MGHTYSGPWKIMTDPVWGFFGQRFGAFYYVIAPVHATLNSIGIGPERDPFYLRGSYAEAVALCEDLNGAL